jgi:hypothetical protein
LNFDLRGVVTAFNQRAAAWWQSVLDEAHSFSKPVYQLGLQGVEVSNVEASGAISLAGSSVPVLGPMLNMAAAKVGDGFCCRVKVSNLCTLRARLYKILCRTVVECSLSNSCSHLAPCTDLAAQ